MKAMLGFFCLMCVLTCGCGGAKVEAKSGAGKRAEGSSMGRIDEGSRCDGKGRREELVDLDQDGKPDVRKVYAKTADADVLMCREADLNFDGTKDLFVFFDNTGGVARDEVDLDYDGKIDIVSTYVKGKVIKQEIDTNSDGMVDKVRFLDNDQPVRLEGDNDGDGRVDYWEYYEAGKLVRVGQDSDGDGKADTWSRDDQAEQTASNEGEGADNGAASDGEAPPPEEKAAEPKPEDKSKAAPEDKKGKAKKG